MRSNDAPSPIGCSRNLVASIDRRSAYDLKLAAFVSDSFRERLAQKQRDKIASEIARGDEAAINARLGRFRSVVPWVVITLLIIGGCAVTRTVYVKEQDRVTALRPGEVYSNATDAVEWVVPRTVMTQLVIANEGIR